MPTSTAPHPLLATAATSASSNHIWIEALDPFVTRLGLLIRLAVGANTLEHPPALCCRVARNHPPDCSAKALAVASVFAVAKIAFHQYFQ